MASLILSDFKCVEATDDGFLSDDSPYFVFFIGKGNNPDAAKLVRIRQPHWDNDVGTGDVYHPNATVASVDANTLVLCGLMEEDNNADIVTGNGAFKNIRKDMITALKAYAGGGSTPVGQLATALLLEFAKALNTYSTNDDVVKVIHVPTNINLEQHGSFKMDGEGGQYKVWFKN